MKDSVFKLKVLKIKETFLRYKVVKFFFCSFKGFNPCSGLLNVKKCAASHWEETVMTPYTAPIRGPVMQSGGVTCWEESD